MARLAWSVAWVAALSAAAVAAEEKPGPISFKRDIEPIFVKSCWGCHNSGDPKGGLSMDTVALTLKGGKNGAGWEKGSKGKAADSLFIQYLDGRKKPQMPKDKKPLTAAKIDLIKRWIDEGAIDDGDPKPTRLPRNQGPHKYYPFNPSVTALAWDKQNRFVAA